MGWGVFKDNIPSVANRRLRCGRHGLMNSLLGICAQLVVPFPFQRHDPGLAGLGFPGWIFAWMSQTERGQSLTFGLFGVL